MTPEEVEKALYGHLQTPASAAPAVVAPTVAEPALDDDHVKAIEKSLYGDAGAPSLTKADYQIAPDYTLHKMGAGVAAGMAGRAAINRVNPDMLYNPEIEKQAAALPEMRENVGMSRDIHHEQQQRLEELRAQQQHAEYLHEQNRKALEAAHMEHAYANTLTPEDILKQEGKGPKSVAAVPVPTVTPTTAPVGGTGTAAYAEKFGATPEEAKRVPSMSVMQQQNIPQQAQAWEKIGALAPSFQQYAESPLLLGPEGKEALGQRLQTEQRNQTLETLKQVIMSEDEKQEHQEAKSKVSHRKASAQAKLDTAKLSAKESHENLQEIKRLINKMESRSTPASEAAVRHQEHSLQELEDRVRKQFGNTRAEQVLSYVGRKVLPRFTPYAGAALAPLEAEKAAEEWKRGNKMKAAAYGLGALGGVAQSTGIPIAMGAGDVMQIPSIAIGLNEALGGNTAP